MVAACHKTQAVAGCTSTAYVHRQDPCAPTAFADQTAGKVKGATRDNSTRAHTIDVRGANGRRPPAWKPMSESEADRVFPARKGQASQAPTDEKRLIQGRPRRGGVGGSQPRVVEVVHVRRDRARAEGGQPRPAARGVRAETWPDGFAARSAQPLPAPDIAPAAPEPAQPAVHAMPMWEPSAHRVPGKVSASEAAPAGTAPPARRGRRSRPSHGSAERARRYADPFAAGDDGANCLRCGYLVERAREGRGLLTCSACG